MTASQVWRGPRVGDLFTVRGRRLAGRVVSTTAVVGPTHGCIVVYLYADAQLSRDALLAPPLLTTRAPWSRGLFVSIRSEALVPGRAFGRHAFRDARGALLDEMGRPLDAAAEAAPVGEYRLYGIEAIEALLARSDAAYDIPPPAAATAGDVAASVKAIVAQWTAAFGRPPTLEEWDSLYDVAIDGDGEGPIS